MARRLVFSQNGLTSTASVPEGLRYIGYSGSNFSEKFGATVSEIGGSQFFTTTISEILISASNSTLKPGSLYQITDAHTDLYGGTEIILQAISTTELGSRGKGKFYNPIYGGTANGVWDDVGYFGTSVFTATFSKDELITANNGAIGQSVGIIVPRNFGSTQFALFRPTSGTWSAATSITGNTSGATTSISDIYLPSYTIGQKVIWGGKVWTNLTGNVGNSTNEYTLDGTNWSEVSYNSTDYSIVWDEITYDFTNDFITSRKDNSGNYVEQSYSHWNYESGVLAIKGFQWGNTGTIYDNYCRNSIFEIVNFRGTQVSGTSVTGGSWLWSNYWGENSYLYYCKLSNYSYFNDNLIHSVASQAGIFEVSIEDFSYVGDNFFYNGTTIEACQFKSSGLENCILSSVDSYDCTFLSGAYFQYLFLYSRTTMGCFIRYCTLNGTTIRFTENTFPYSSRYFNDKNISGVHSQSSAINIGESYPYITSSSSPIWENFPGGSSKPSKNLVRKDDNSWAITYLTAGGTFSVTSI